MDNQALMDELLQFFKALADANRLKIISLLAQDEYSVEQIAEILGLKAPTVSHHLSKLMKAGLVSARAESYYNFYRLETKTLEEMSTRILAAETLPAVASDVDVDAYDRKILKNYSNPDGSLKAIPNQEKKLLAVLRHIVKVFEPGEKYSEAEVKEKLIRFNEDYAQLRREMVEYGFMAREGGGGVYWRTEKE